MRRAKDGQSPVLDVDLEPRSLLLSSPSGEPVWPAPHPAADELRQTATLFGASTAQTTGIPVPEVDGGNGGQCEDVVALGGGAILPEARLYAHLTRRRFRFVEHLSQLLDSRRPAVVITRSRDLTHELLDYLYSVERDGPAPGILFADDTASLRRQVLFRSAASLLNGPLSCRRVTLIPPADFATESLPDHDIIGGRADEAVVLAGLERGAGVLSVSTHSDGIDAFITPLLTLCPFDRIPAAGDAGRSPVCCATGFCHRSDIPVAQAIVDGRLLSANAIAARIFVWNVCNGVIPSSGKLGQVIDFNWGLIPRMLESPRIGAILTTWYHTLWPQLPIETLCAEIASGTPVGAALAAFHRSRASRASGIRLCLLGDPQLALPCAPTAVPSHSPVEPPPDRTVRRPRRDAPIPDPTLADAEFLRLWLTGVSQTNRRNEARASAERAVAAVAAYVDAGSRAAEEQNADDVGADMRERVISHLAEFGTFAARSWLRQAEMPTLQVPPPQCFACGLQTNTYAARAKAGAFGPRRVGICPGCGVIEDVPATSTASMQLDADMSVRLQGVAMAAAWTCKVVTESMGPRSRASWDWPQQQDGRPAESFTLPGPFPPGPIRVVIILMSGAELFILQQPGRAPKELWQ